ncbi:hypothetical protein ACNOYE_36725 [Nannocystaceae bacterium ST9]
MLSAVFATSMWLVEFGAPNRPSLRVPDAGEKSWPGGAVASSDPAGLIVGEFQLDPTRDTEALARLADLGVWAYGLASSGDARFTEMAAALADLHYIRDRRMWCDEHHGSSIDVCIFNLDFVACRQADSTEAEVVYARAILDSQAQHEDCPAHVACIAHARIGSHLPMPELGPDGCIGVIEALSHANFPSPRWYEDRATIASTIAHWQVTVDDPWGRFDPANPIDRLEMLKAKNTLAYLRLTLEERFGH